MPDDGMSVVTLHDTDEWVCECGNESHTDGFYPCDENGRICSPEAESDWDGTYTCDRCSRLHAMNPCTHDWVYLPEPWAETMGCTHCGTTQR
jgi:hypothetical protein